jgi:hypothetical protein
MPNSYPIDEETTTAPNIHVLCEDYSFNRQLINYRKKKVNACTQNSLISYFHPLADVSTLDVASNGNYDDNHKCHHDHE